MVDVHHPGAANISKDDLRKRLATIYKSEADRVFVFGFRTAFGGSKSTGFALVYNTLEAAKKFEPKYRLERSKLYERKKSGSSKNRKELKNRKKKTRGTGKKQKRSKD